MMWPAWKKSSPTARWPACLIEPVMTNIGIIHPQDGYHQAVRELTKKYGTLLIIDETHTICTGPGGYTKAHDLKPDFLTIGKPIASGLPASAYGFSAEVARKNRRQHKAIRLRYRRHRRHSRRQRTGTGSDASHTWKKSSSRDAYAKTIPSGHTLLQRCRRRHREI